jgi:uncharacterized protein YuzE
VGKREEELSLLRRVTQKRKEAIAQEHPGIFAMEKIETDETLAMEYVLITLKKDGEVMGYEFIENPSTFLIEAKAKRYTDILKRGYYLGIVVPGQSRDRALALRSQFREKELMNPAFFVYDEYGDISRL